MTSASPVADGAEAMPGKPVHIGGIDYIRALMSILVVAWHAGGAGRSSIFSREGFSQHVVSLSDVINFNLLLLAVPTFIFVTCYLQALGGTSRQILAKRLGRIFILVTFWPVAYILFHHGHRGIQGLLPSSAGDLLETLLTAGHTIYYFFVSQIICILIAHWAMRMGTTAQIAGLSITCAIVTAVPFITCLSQVHQLSAYWNPLNFIHYPFAAVLFARNRGWLQARIGILVPSLLLLFAVASSLEWTYLVDEIFFPGQGYAFPAYTRISLIFGVSAVMMAVLNIEEKPNAVIVFMSMNSLALYCLHPFLIGPVKVVMGKVLHAGAFSNIVAMVIIIVASYVMAIVVRRYVKSSVIG